MMDPGQYVRAVVDSNRRGERRGICSICSANRFVLESAMLEAGRSGSFVCIESTSNQVNQSGGYTGMTPFDFTRFVRGIASAADFPHERILLGGDHLGPFPWRNEPAATALRKAADLVRDYVLAGFTKIHLDASMSCADDPGGTGAPLNERIATDRTALLCEAAEDARRRLPEGSAAPIYVIGTEVPTPGGEQSAGGIPEVTKKEDLDRTLSLTRSAFENRGLDSAWSRVVAVVVQPGVDFGDDHVAAYCRERAQALSERVGAIPGLVFEAHSTDYQTRTQLGQLVEDHFAILKVGPWLTFALREAVFALEAIEAELLPLMPSAKRSGFRDALDQVMVRDPAHWRGYYRGGGAAQAFARKFSYSDRCRYYWPQPEVQQALAALFANLGRIPVPVSLLSQYLPEQYQAVCEGKLDPSPEALVRDRIGMVLRVYADACGEGIRS